VRVAQQKLRILRIVFCLSVFGCLLLGLEVASAAAAAKLKVLDASASESASALRFSVKLTGNTERPVRVSYRTVSGTAKAGSDFSTVMGQLAFQPDTKKRTIVVNIISDAIPEEKETLAVKLWNPIGATIARARATGTIRDDDPPNAPPPNQGMGGHEGQAPLAAPSIVINEILADPKGTASDYEFVELLNVRDSPVDLSGWTINAGTDCALTGVLPGGGLYVVSNDVTIRDSSCPLSLKDTGDTITVRDGPSGTGTVIDSVDYTGFPINQGESIGLDPTRADPVKNDLASNWCTAFAAGETFYGPSENTGSPGTVNGPCFH
jgi:hypothetical protein